MPPKQAVKHIGLFGIRGRNGSDPPYAIPDYQCREALNVDFFQSSFGRKCNGAAPLAITGGTAFSSGVRAGFRHVPGFDQAAAEFWGVDGTGLVKRLAAGTAWANVSLTDAITSDFGEVNAVSFNGKLVLCYNSTVNRAHVYDPVTGTVRQMGHAIASAPTVANTGSGSYAAVVRYYKVAYTTEVSGITTRRSNISSSVTFTPSGSGTAARVTKPASIGEGETHWELYGSPDDAEYFLLSTIAVGTTTYDDSAAPSGYDGETPFDDGAFTPPPSARYVQADDARLIFGGAWETTTGTGMVPSVRRIWWTSSLGATDEGDDERISNTEDIKNYADIEEAVTGLSKPIQGAFYVFSYDSQWKFVSTGNIAAPFLRFRVSGGAGCVQHKTITVADDEDGDPATYWWSYRGPMRIGKNGQQWIGEDILDIIETINLDATSPMHSVFHPTKHQVWFYVPVDGSNTANRTLIFDTRIGRFSPSSGGVRNGWSVQERESAKAYFSCPFSNSVGASMGRALKPHIGYTTSTEIWKCDHDTAQDDSGIAFQSYVDSKPLVPWGLGRKGGINQECHMVAKTASNVILQLTLMRDEGAKNLTSTASLKPISDGGAETRVFPQFEGSMIADCKSLSVRLGDAAAISNNWNVDALILPWEAEGEA